MDSLRLTDDEPAVAVAGKVPLLPRGAVTRPPADAQQLALL